jgi:CheY-like chemotaxis protein
MLAAKKNVVLVVEEEADVRQLCASELEAAGYAVVEVETCAEALKIMTEGAQVGVLVTDMKMHGHMNGLELARLFHCLWPHVKLLVTSGVNRLRPADVPGRGRLLSKPYARADLCKTVSELIGASDWPLTSGQPQPAS